MPIILRLIKGSELTFAELDGNFQDLDNRTDALEAIDAGTRLTRLEAAGTPIYFDSDDVMVMLDSIWAGGVYSYLATTDSIGLASFDSDHFNVNNGHVTIKLAGYTPSDSAGIASFDSSNFVISAGHVTINPNSAAGRVAGTTIIDSTGVASFADADFNVTTNGHVTLTDSAVRTRISAVNNSGSGTFAYRESTGEFVYDGPSLATTSTVGVASFSSSDFSVNGSGQVSLAGGSGIPVSSGVNVVGSIMILQTSGMSNNEVYAPGASVPGNKLGYGANTISPSSFSFRRATNGSVEVGTGSNPYIQQFFTGVSGTWRNLGPGVVGYKSGWFTQGNTGSSGYALFQRIA